MDVGILRKDGRTDPFFDAAAEDRLLIKRCEPCDRWLTPDQTGCAECGGNELSWAEASGEATLVSWTTLHGRPAEDGTTPPPVHLALVELAEGPWLHGRLTEVDPAALREGLPLRAVFVHPEEGESYLLFRPA
ncbi:MULTISPECIES: Zn-ribbon domain-containing OB-fold protein [Thermomonospora]|uniref:DUF35 domain-containing protein n=1 Tax=Thermomonospora curvata (strain ATCC 19995 / DSM 43183 / JCM 3096 / KCTC 9072 / NBRC 15933 / NCIMB 10081 / Henssen B9) TaxID=471852 RepID=D1A6Y1_THECD|nr:MULTISPECIES: OB-fold domain-containing protein [Thermomonospora]ACY98385.1 protein of unknown function DUF35 [Thermomonospora curvata DSM 43183]PKK13540.1 MAG: hypothetical protein BUE48_013830 [Thermomonospora sp. CIF 1]